MPNPNTSGGPRRVFLGWGEPLLSPAVQRLTEGWTGGTLDLSATAVLAPTGESGRRLRKRLAMAAAEKGAALLPPLVATPETVLSWSPVRKQKSATAAQNILAWSQVLLRADLEEFRALFPVDPVAKNFRWATQAASEFQRLGKTLGERGLSISDAARRLGDDLLEADRWQQLARLESRRNQALAAIQTEDAESIKSRAAEQPKLPEGLRKVVLLAVADPLPLATHALGVLADQGIPVEVWIHAPESLADHFDAWGRPRPEPWAKRPLPLATPERTIRQLARPADQAAEIIQLIQQAEGAGLETGLALADAEVAPLLLNDLEDAGLDAYLPEGLPFPQHLLHWILTVWIDVLKLNSWAAFGRLLRIPQVHSALASAAAPIGTQPFYDFRRSFDQLNEDHLPPDLTAALEHASAASAHAVARAQALASAGKAEDDPEYVRAQQKSRATAGFASALQTVLAWKREFLERPLTTALPDFLRRIFPASIEEEPSRHLLAQADKALMEALASAEQATDSFATDLDAAQRLDFLLHLMRDVRLFPLGNQGWQLSGWLEVAWEDASCLIVSGLNEGLVPESVSSDAWLPHGLRVRLGLKTNEARFARDAFLLTALLESRRRHGEVHLLLGRESAQGDPLKPSRLLLQCPREELPRRVAFLFPDNPDAVSHPPVTPAWTRAWPLLPPNPQDHPIKSIYVTQFRDYLECPFRFYLKHALGMEPCDAAKEEMNARDFGKICHNALEHMAKDPEASQSTDAAFLAAWLQRAVERETHRQFGTLLGVPLLVQLEAAKARLAAVAQAHVNSRLEGWRVVEVEVSFREMLGEDFNLAGFPISGRIDLIERHEKSGQLRILDYKTSGDPVSPREAHLKALRGQTDAPSWSLCGHERWTNLQLPLYALAARKKYGERLMAGYFNVPRAASQTAILTWEEIAEGSLLRSAEECAIGVLQAIQRAEFWPPSERPTYDDFDSLFINGVTAAIDPSLLLAGRKGEWLQLT